MLILASKSPRRIELLGLLKIPFEIMPAKGKEVVEGEPSPEELALRLAEKKAEEIFSQYPDAMVIGADTIVVCRNEVLGKPASPADAERMLGMLSGRTHSVFTGVSVITKSSRASFTDETVVEFYPLEKEEIASYIESGEPFDKAGAYGIQERGALFIKRIIGDYYNVMGLPIARLYRIMSKM